MSSKNIGDIMNIEDIEIYEEKPIRLVLMDGKTEFYGTFKIKDEKTIHFTDRFYKTFPIDISMIGLAVPIDKIRYQGESSD